MSVQVRCPVFRCPKTSITQCTGHRRTCERSFCQTHSQGTLCDRCARIKQEDMKSGYRQILKSLERKSYPASLTMGVVALFLISLLLLTVAAVCAFLQKNDQGVLPIFIISLGAGVLGFCGSLIWYLMKAREFMRSESVELDLNHPGFYDYYRQWQEKINEITTNNY
jgi:hypothetical protein